jgi:hypothetical protein
MYIYTHSLGLFLKILIKTILAMVYGINDICLLHFAILFLEAIAHENQLTSLLKAGVPMYMYTNT